MRSVITALCIVAASVVMAAAPAAPDPWLKVPRPPTACYTSQDKYGDEIYAAIEALHQEISRQQEINDQLKAQLDALDPMERTSRMQNYLMQNPQEAAKVMQAVQDQGTAVQGAIQRSSDNEQKLQGELKDIQASYDAELDKLTGPLYANLKALGISESGTPQKTVDAGIVIVKKINAEYERFCPTWWGPSGPFNEWLKRYKAHLVQDRIPNPDDLEVQKTVQFTIFGIAADGFKTTIPQETVIDYMNQTLKIFNHRPLMPRENLVMPQ